MQFDRKSDRDHRQNYVYLVEPFDPLQHINVLSSFDVVEKADLTRTKHKYTSSHGSNNHIY